MKILNFVRWNNLYNCNETVKTAAYLGLVCPKLEYESAVWDPHLSKDINAIFLASYFNREDNISQRLFFSCDLCILIYNMYH